MESVALAGYKILDLTEGIAGPYCTRLLAGLGAEVIKVERPGTGDPTRSCGPFHNDEAQREKSVVFLYFNTAKKSVTLSLEEETGHQILKDLVRHVDILVESFPPGLLTGLKLGYEALSEINPGLVMASISNFGQYGPYRDYKIDEMIAYAMSGLMYITGEFDREPLKLGIDAAQCVAGQNLLVAILACLYDREVSGAGRYIDTSVVECCAGLLEYQWGQYAYTDYVSTRTGIANEKGHPWGILPCKNGWVALAPRDVAFRHLAELTGIPELLDPKFATTYDRIQHRDELDALLIPWLMDHNKEELFPMLTVLPSTAAGYVRCMDELLDDPQLKHSSYWVEANHPIVGSATYPGAPFRMGECAWQVGRAPLLGEHNQEVYGTYLGLSKYDICTLMEARII